MVVAGSSIITGQDGMSAELGDDGFQRSNGAMKCPSNFPRFFSTVAQRFGIVSNDFVVIQFTRTRSESLSRKHD